MAAYYNELEPFAADWLENLDRACLIEGGKVDRRSIADVRAEDVRGFDRAHFFAGIGGWDYALQLAGWDASRPVWTGSCPCQPFSSAGKRRGFADERHLWSEWFRCICKCRPPVIFGEQVASPDALRWLDAVRADLEGEGYAVGAADLCAAGVGAPHLRQRLYWVAHVHEAGRLFLRSEGLRGDGLAPLGDDAHGRGATGELGDPGFTGTWGHGRAAPGEEAEVERARILDGRFCNQPDSSGAALDLGDPERQGLALGQEPTHLGGAVRDEGTAAGETEPIRGVWAGADWIYCRDGKYRPVEPGAFPLAHGVPGRVGKLRAYGNAIVPQVAATFIRAWMETVDAPHLAP